MIKERYVSFEIAILLKEKGFNERTFGSYDMNGKFQKGSAFWNNLATSYSAPTLYMAMEWLREKGIFIAINNDDLDYNWQCFDLINRGSTGDPKILSSSCAGYKTFEKAAEDSIKYSLEILV